MTFKKRILFEKRMNTSTIYQSNPSFPDKIHLLHSVVEKIESTYFRLDICTNGILILISSKSEMPLIDIYLPSCWQ